MVYDELRRLADRFLRDEPCDHTLQSTALVHEVFIRLVGCDTLTWANRADFFATAARAMRRMLIDHARGRRAVKRGGGRRGLSLDHVEEPADRRDACLVALDDALHSLAVTDPDLANLVELRFFAGLSIDETARVLGVAPATVKRRWQQTRVRLASELDGVRGRSS